MLDSAGIDLSRNPHAFNETLRLLIRLSFPFFVLITVSLLTSSGNIVPPGQFFIKMRTPVSPGGLKYDKGDLEKAYMNATASGDVLIFKYSNLEFYKWHRKDWYGFLFSWSIVFVILVLLYAVVSVGK